MLNLEKKILLACIIGKSNVGKSTLLNKIIGKKISIVTPKVQTTRSIITGITTIKDTQLIFFDTPGIFFTKKHQEKAMTKYAWSALDSADIVLIVLDSCLEIDNTLKSVILKVRKLGKKAIFILNKMDLKPKLYIKNFTYLKINYPDLNMFNISALTSQGIESLIEFLRGNAQIGNWLYAKNDTTDLPMSFLLSEVTREQLFLNLGKELPYNLTVQNESFQNKKDGSIKINQNITVPKQSYKDIIIGSKGRKIKEISSKARNNMEELLNKKVHLFIFVKELKL